ncbi:sigma-70 family RNA polymerase sigma factor [Luteibacter sp. PPL201]|uniref:RNA polymerase sigma factor n=2 Tax=Luteibacter sahnii TaxID=3021977 RepID=A0ABT6BBT6_9GAMM|nr:sigma-70 family RNA polymerase sigma factor [Luteibacter sp. PPL193]MDY1547545.1 sigma-70 family RNA polymerase sigma factor [Luteibacter sp. PPL193]
MRTDPVPSRIVSIEAARRVSVTVSRDSTTDWSAHMAAVAARQDVDAFMRIFDHFGPRLQRYLVGMSIAPSQAEELVQEAMLRVWRRAAQFDPARANVSTWLFRIARNLYIDSVRNEPHWLEIQDALDQLDDLAATPGESPAESFADGVGLERAVNELPPQQARMIRMSYFEAKSHSEIARELGQPLGSVKSSLRRAFAKLQSALGKTP